MVARNMRSGLPVLRKAASGIPVLGASPTLEAPAGGEVPAALEPAPPSNAERIEGAVRTILEGVGEDPDREGLRATPARVAASLAFLTEGYHQDPREVVGD